MQSLSLDKALISLMHQQYFKIPDEKHSRCINCPLLMADVMLLAVPSEGWMLAAELITVLHDTTYISINCTLNYGNKSFLFFFL